MSVIVATVSVTTIAPYTISFNRAATAAAQLFKLIDRQSKINPFDNSGEKPSEVRGIVEIEKVTFSYPTRPGVTVLDDYSLHIPAGKVTALVVNILIDRYVLYMTNTIVRVRVGQERVQLLDCLRDGISLVLDVLNSMESQ
jgi:ABC-type transport system involved in Fe-S cluster assembly fused permease/ATPase subunit